jgi:hypothetical protein
MFHSPNSLLRSRFITFCAILCLGTQLISSSYSWNPILSQVLL